MTAHRKGVNHIDFAIAASVIVIITAFSIYYVTNYFSRVTPNDKTMELQAVASGIAKILFESPGIPDNWENNSYAPVRVGLRTNLPRVAVLTAEKAGVNRSFEEIDTHIVFDRNCLNITFNNSIRLYDQFMNETNFRIYNYTECAANSGFLREANINFLFNITANSPIAFWLYYTNDTSTPKKPAYNFSYDSSLVGYWKLDSVNGTNYTFDSTNYRNDGLLKNFPCDPATCNLTEGQIKNGLSFDGTDDYVQTQSFLLYNYNYMTFEAWIYPNTLSSRSTILGQENALKLPHIEVGPANGGNKRVAAYAPETWLAVTQDNVIDVSNWYHIAYARNGSFSQKIYVNGISQTLVIDTYIASDPTASPKYIGQWGTNIRFFNGAIDEVRLYNRTLTADEVKAHYNFTKPYYVTSSKTVPIMLHKKMSAMQNLSYSDVRTSLDMKKNFNITACDYSFGRHIPDIVNVISSSYPIMLINSSGYVKPCMAAINIW